MELKFEKPALKIVRFDVRDVLMASPSNPDVPTGTGEWETPIIPTP